MTFESGVKYCCYSHMVAAGELCCLSNNSGCSCYYLSNYICIFTVSEYIAKILTVTLRAEKNQDELPEDVYEPYPLQLATVSAVYNVEKSNTV